MFRTACVLPALLALAAPPGDGRPVRVLARGAWPHLPTHTSAGVGTDRATQLRVIRSDAELAKAAGAGARVTVPQAFKLPAVDFTKHMLLAVEDGTQPLVGTSGGAAPSAPYVVSIVRVERDAAGKVLTVRWRRLGRRPDQVLTRPLEAVLVERSDAEVRFEKLPDPTVLVADPPPAGAEVPVAGRAFWPDGWPPEAPRKEWVVRGEDDLIDPRLRAPEPVLERMRAEAKARYAKALGVADIDFGKQTIVGVSVGVQPAGSRVEVVRATTDPAGKLLTVSWKFHPAPTDRPADGVAHPAAVVLIDRGPSDVRFREEK